MATPTQIYPTRQKDPFGTILGNTFQLIGASWNALLLNIKTFAILFLSILVSIAVFSALLLAPALGGIMVEDTSTVALDSLNATGVIAGIVGIVGMIVIGVIIATAVTITSLASAQGKVLPVKAALQQSQSLFLPVLLLGVLSILAIVLGLLLFILPGIAAIFFLSFAIYVLIDKKCAPIDALKGSYELTKKNWKIVLAYFVVQAAINVVGYFPFLGQLASFVLTIAYLCLPAILYIRMQKQNPVTKHV